MRVALFNARQLGGKDRDILQFADSRKIELFLLLETWNRPEQSQIISGTFINLCQDKSLEVINGGKRHGGGILGFATKEVKQLISIIYVDPAAHYLIFRVADIHFAVAYLPPSLPDSFLTAFLDTVASKIGDNPCYIMGDLNARLGSLTRDHYESRRGRVLKAYILDSDITLHHPIQGKWTTYSGVGRGITDLLLSVNAPPVSDFTVHEDESLGSDHRPLTFEINMELPPERQFDRWNVRRLADDSVAEEYRRILEEKKFQVIRLMNLHSESNHQWEAFKNWLSEAAELSCGKIRYRAFSKSSFWTEDLLKTKGEINVLNRQLTEAHRNGYSLASQRNISKQLTQLNGQFRKAMSHRKLAIFSDMASNMGKKQNAASFMKMVSNTQARLNRKGCKLDPAAMTTHAAHFASTFGLEATGDAADPLTVGEYIPPAFSVARVRDLLRRTGMGKAAGTDGFMGEFLVHGSEVVAYPMWVLLQTIARTCRIPDEWREALIIPVFKNKGTETEAKNYRPIALTVIARRLYERLIAPELEPAISKLSKTQGGFRRNRSTLDQCFVLQEIIQHNPAAQHAFLDFKAAFDSVNRQRLWTILQHNYDVPYSTVCRLMDLFDSNFSRLVIGGRQSEPIPNLRGLLQGSALSPILFNFFIDPLLKLLSSTNALVRSGPNATNHLAFADDINIHAENIAGLQDILNTCISWAITNGMQYQPLKCVQLGAADNPESPLTMYGMQIPQQRTFQYLGIPFDVKGVDFEENFTARANKAKNIAAALNRIGMNVAGFPPAASARLYKAFIRPVMEYGLQLAPQFEIHLESLRKAQSFALKKIFSAPRNTSGNAVMRLLQVEPIAARNLIVTCQFYGRLHNSNDSNIPAVRFWRAAIQGSNRKSFAMLMNDRNRNPLWQHCKRVSILTNPLQSIEFSKPVAALSKAQQSKYAKKTLSKLDLGLSNVSASIQFDESDTIRPCLTSEGMPETRIRIPIYRWLLGNVAVHKTCNYCGEIMSRTHAVECSNAAADLLMRYPVTVPPAGNAIDAILNYHRAGAPDPDFYAAVATAIGTIYQHCLGYRQNEKGFYSLPDPAEPGIPAPTEREDPQVAESFERPPRNPR